MARRRGRPRNRDLGLPVADVRLTIRMTADERALLDRLLSLPEVQADLGPRQRSATGLLLRALEMYAARFEE